jgi:hypothetical protein
LTGQLEVREAEVAVDQPWAHDRPDELGEALRHLRWENHPVIEKVEM